MSLTLIEVKSKSALKIATLEEPLRSFATALIELSYAIGIYVIITEAKRTYDYQNYLYSKGRTRKQLDAVGLYKVEPLPNLDVVTNAIGGHSNHNFGYALDFALLMKDGRTVKWDTKGDYNLDDLPDWSQVVEIAKRLGAEWGGDWRSFTDMPHLQMVFGLSTEQFRLGKRPSPSMVTAVLKKIQTITATKIPTVVESIAYTFTVAGKDNGIAFLEGATTYVPLVSLSKAIGVTYKWDNESKVAYVNNRALSDARVIEGRAYVQLRPVATAYGKQVVFDKQNKKTGVA